MGRSANSRNRMFVKDNDGLVRTAPVDSNNVQDAKLIIYNAMRETDDFYVVSNGDQTDTVIMCLDQNLDLYGAMGMRQYEPDKPNFTPRITAVCSLINSKPMVEMSILRKSLFGDGCDRALYTFDELCPGIGYCLTTYSSDGDPLPSFRGEPLLMPLEGNLQEIAGLFWKALDPENRVALVVKFIGMDNGSIKSRVHIINKYA